MAAEPATLEKVFQAERQVARVRAAVIAVNVLVWAFFLDPAATIPWLAVTIVVGASAYGAVVVAFEPYRRFPALLTSYATTALDGALILLWIAATGGASSPFFVLWYVSLVAIAYRFGFRATLAATAAYAACYAGLLAAVGAFAAPATDAVVRTAYIGFVGGLAALLAREATAQTRGKVEMRQLAEVTPRLAGPLDLERTLREVVGAARELVGADRGAIYLLEGGGLRCAHASGLSSSYVEARIRDFRVLPGYAAMLRSEPFLGGDALTDPRLAPLREEVRAEGFRSYATFPLAIQGTPIGMLTLYRDRVHPFSAHEAALASKLAERAAIAIENARLVKQLRGREEKFRGLLESAPDAMIIMDEGGRIALVNSQTERMFGYTRGELVGQPIQVLVPEHSRRAHADHRRDFAADPRARPMGAGLDLHARRRDGTEFPVEISLAPLRTEEGSFVTAAVRDVTERRRADEELRRTMEGLAEAQRVAHLGSWDWEVATDRLRWSDELFRLYGLEPRPEGLRYQDFLALIHPEDRDWVDQTVGEAAHRGRPFSFEHRILRPDGTVRWLFGQGRVTLGPDGKATRMAGTALDITERKEAEVVVRRLAALVESAPQAVFGVSLEGRIESWNPGAQALFGWSPGEAIGQPVTMLIPPERMDEVLRQQPFEEPGHGTIQVETERLHKDGTRVPVWLSFSPIRDDHGRLLGGATILADLRERRRIEEQRRADEGKLQELGRLKELDRFKTQFINMAAHELGTPLTPLKLQVYVLKTARGANLTPEQRKSIAILEKNVDRLAQLVQDILEVARLQAGRLGVKRVPMDLHRAVLEAVESFEDPAKHAGVRLELRSAPGLLIRGDENRLTQVLFNLLSNALKFTPRGGSVTVETARSKGSAVVQVRDTGVGLAPEDAERLFHPFTQVHDPMQRTQPGTGLGLYISKGLVELHGGRIGVESDGPGLGSTFAFELPLEDAPSPKDSPADDEASRRRQGIARRARELVR